MFVTLHNVSHTPPSHIPPSKSHSLSKPGTGTRGAERPEVLVYVKGLFKHTKQNKSRLSIAFRWIFESLLHDRSRHLQQGGQICWGWPDPEVALRLLNHHPDLAGGGRAWEAAEVIWPPLPPPDSDLWAASSLRWGQVCGGEATSLRQGREGLPARHHRLQRGQWAYQDQYCHE